MAIDLSLNIQTLAGATRANSTVTKPTGTASGDLLLCGLYCELGSAQTVTVPSGFTEITTVFDPSEDFRIVLAYRHADGTEGASFAWTHISTWTNAFCWRLTGTVTSGSPEDATRSTNNGTGTLITSTGITTATDGAALIQMAGTYSSGGFTLSTLTEYVDLDSSGVFADLQATAGASGNKTVTTGSAGWAAMLIALKPAAGGAASVVTPRLFALLGVGA